MRVRVHRSSVALKERLESMSLNCDPISMTQNVVTMMKSEAAGSDNVTACRGDMRAQG